MKLFSRKALVAVATTAALTVSGMSAPAFAEPTTEPANISSSSSTTTEEGKGGEDTSSSFDGSSDEDGKVNPTVLRNWIGVFTAVIAALSTAFTFIQKIN